MREEPRRRLRFLVFGTLSLVYSRATHADLLSAFSAIGPAVSGKDCPRNPAAGPHRKPDVCRTSGDGGKRRELAGRKGGTRRPGCHPGGEPSTVGGGLPGNYLRGK